MRYISLVYLRRASDGQEPSPNANPPKAASTVAAILDSQEKDNDVPSGIFKAAVPILDRYLLGIRALFAEEWLSDRIAPSTETFLHQVLEDGASPCQPGFYSAFWNAKKFCCFANAEALYVAQLKGST